MTILTVKTGAVSEETINKVRAKKRGLGEAPDPKDIIKQVEGEGE